MSKVFDALHEALVFCGTVSFRLATQAHLAKTEPNVVHDDATDLIEMAQNLAARIREAMRGARIQAASGTFSTSELNAIRHVFTWIARWYGEDIIGILFKCGAYKHLDDDDAAVVKLAKKLEAPASPDRHEDDSDPLTFAELRAADVARTESGVFGSGTKLYEWSPTDWATALAGEVGELCNLIKKRRRGDAIEIGRLAEEAADAAIYLDLLTARLGIDLGAAVRAKFNVVSDRYSSSVRLPSSHHTTDTHVHTWIRNNDDRDNVCTVCFDPKVHGLGGALAPLARWECACGEHRCANHGPQEDVR